MKVAIFLTVALISFTIFTLGVASLPVISFPYKSSVSYAYPSNYNPGLWKPFSLTGFQILEFQSAGPTITSFTIDFTDSNGDGKANANENVNMICSATDSNGLDFILLTRKAPDGGSSDYGSGGAAGGATSWTIPSTVVSLVQAGTYEFICTARNVNGTSTTSTKTLDVVAAPTCTPSSAGSCTNSDSCTASSGKWCMGSGYSNSYCDVAGASCTTPSMCGNSVCDKGEGSQYGPTMCPQDCGGSPSPSSGSYVCGDNVCSQSESKYSCSKDCGIATDRCNSGVGNGNCESGEDYWNCWKDCPQSASPSPGASCNVDPYPLKTKNTCEAAGCLWCQNENVCKAGSGSSCAGSVYTPQCNQNGVCDQGESQTSCSIDCGISDGYKNGCGGSSGKCGDGSCNINCNVQEDWYICHTDCPKSGTPVTTPVSCNTIDPSGCQSESTCKATGANWCATTSGSFCSKSASCSQVPTPTVLPNQTLQPTPIPRNLIPTKPLVVLESETFEIREILSALEPFEINISERVFNTSGIQKLHLGLLQNISGNITMEIKSLDNIPVLDEKNQQLFLPEETYIKVIQFVPSQELSNSVNQATIEFALTDAELSASNMKIDDVVLARFTNNTWEELPTEYLGNQTGIHQFKATTTGFSVFIVTKKKQIGIESTTSPIPEIDRRRDIQLIKSNLVSALITIEQFKIKFDQLASTSKKIADYYLVSDKPQDYTNWFAISKGFSDSIVKLDEVRRDIKSIKSEPTQQDLERIENIIEEVLKVLDSSIDFLLKDVLDIGALGEETEIPLAINQSIKFQVNGEEHTLTVQSISPTGEVEFVVQSETQELILGQGEETNLTVASTSSESDTSLKVNKVEKNVVYLTIKSTFLVGLIASDKEVKCLDVESSLDLGSLNSADSKCFNVIADNVVLNGGGKRIDGGGLAYGIKVDGRSGITIKNFVLVNYLTGIKLVNVRDSTVVGMQIDAISGIEVENSSSNKIMNNTIHLITIGSLDQEGVVEGQEILLNEVILNDAGSGAYTPLISITNNLDPSNFSDANGNQLTTLDLSVETTIGSDLTMLEEPVKFKKGQTKLVNTGANSVPTINGDNGYVDLKIKITALGGTITKEFTKKVSLKGN